MIQGETEPTLRNKENPLDLLDEQHLDEDEQEAIIEKFESDFRFNSKIFRVFFIFFFTKSLLFVFYQEFLDFYSFSLVIFVMISRKMFQVIKHN
jgi:hypothetical protein